MDVAECSIDVDSSVYRLSAVKKAAYRLSDRCAAHIEFQGEKLLRVRLTRRQPAREPLDIERLRQDFLNELLDQELRELVAEESAAVRNLILAQAFTRTSLLDPQGEEADFEADPLGISKPTAPPPPAGASHANRLRDAREASMKASTEGG